MRRFLAGFIGMAVLTGLVAGCTRHHPPPPALGQATALVRAGSATTLTAAQVTVVLPEGAAADGSTAALTVTGGGNDLAPPDGVQVAGPVAAVELPGGLAKPATVAFQAPAGVKDGTLIPVVVWNDAAGAWRWVPTTYHTGDATVGATVDHFSRGFLGAIDVQKWAKDQSTGFTNYVSGRHGIAQPRCGDEPAARAGGVQVTSDGGDAVKWCFGVDGGRRVLRVANNLRTYMQISYPAGWQVVDGQSVSFSTDTVARRLGMAAATPKGTASRIVDGGDTLTLAVPPGASGQVRAEMSIVAWAVSAIFFGLDVYRLVAKAAGNALATAAKSATDRFALLLGATGEAEPLEALKECRKATAHLTEMNETNAKDVLEFAWGCVPGIMKSQLQDVQVFAAGVLIGMVGTAVGAILTAVNLLVTGVRQIWDDIASFGGRSDPQYDIRIVVPFDAVAAFAPYVGTWRQHGYTLVIDRNLTANVVGINFDGADRTPGPPDYRERASFTFTVTPSGITATVTAAANPNSDPNGPWPTNWYKQGQKLTVRMGSQPGVLDFGGSRYCTAAAYQTGVCGA